MQNFYMECHCDGVTFANIFIHPKQLKSKFTPVKAVNLSLLTDHKGIDKETCLGIY